ncbi:uncharacterized protein LOC111635019 [Centruroides sculpturatus]|uniref:uncharacterized protein LOC111635019 n=1 Tax=Centruroides sculpturatus TaxID=218467 RepID=UPI000C6ED31A|nr:uncharacterized protein LOC111635019 [Centruroides sculpturatus]
MDRESKIYLSILQCNLERSISATSLLSKQLKYYDLALIQEPYCRKNIPSCLPAFCPILKGTNQLSWAITLVPNTNLSILYHEKYSNENIIVSEIMIQEKRIIILNIYFPGRVDTDSFIDDLQRIVEAFQGIHIIMAGDFNAHSPAWGGDNLDRRGRLLEEFLAYNDLLILNNPFSPPTFHSARGSSWIDVAFLLLVTILRLKTGGYFLMKH